MKEIVDAFFLSLIPLLVAIDVAGITPIYVGLTEGMDKAMKRKIILDSLLTGLIVSIVFIFLGKLIFVILGITVSDFKIGGGLVLLSLAMMDLMSEEKKRRSPSDTMGIVPLGVPLIVGPGVLTTLLILIDNHGIIITFLSLVVGLMLVGLTFINADYIAKIMGKGGTKVISKLTNLLLVAIAIRMMRLGIQGFLN